MTSTAVKDEPELGLFVPSELDDYGLDPYEFRIYARIVRRAGRNDAWESIPKMAQACSMSLSRARRALQLLKAAGLIESVERPGYSTLRRLAPKHKWVHPERLKLIRQSLTPTKSHTPSKSGRGTRTDTPATTEIGVVAELIPPPLSKLTDEGIPIEGNLVKVIPSLAASAGKKLEREKENSVRGPEDITRPGVELLDQTELASNVQTNLDDGKSLAAKGEELNNLDNLPQPQRSCGHTDNSFDTQITQKDCPSYSVFDAKEHNCSNHGARQAVNSITRPLVEMLSSLAANLNAVLAALAQPNLHQMDEPAKCSTAKTPSARISVSQPFTPGCINSDASSSSIPPVAISSLIQHSPKPEPLFESPEHTELLQKLSKLTIESLESLRLNTNLASALDRYPQHLGDALEYFQQAVATWKNKPGIGLFIHALKSGQKPCPTKPGGGWKEWADEATRRQLMSFSQSWQGDILIHFNSGVQRLWSEVRLLSWSEIEKLVADNCLEQIAA